MLNVLQRAEKSFSTDGTSSIMNSIEYVGGFLIIGNV
jgi:hypothetical protein